MDVTIKKNASCHRSGMVSIPSYVLQIFTKLLTEALTGKQLIGKLDNTFTKLLYVVTGYDPLTFITKPRDSCSQISR